MPDRVVMFEGQARSFPADATDEEISRALGAPPATARSSTPRRWTDFAIDALPTIGGTVGSVAGGGRGPVAGVFSAIGGAAGEGYRQISQHAKELPGAVSDVLHNLIDQPSATMRGFVQGGAQGAKDAAIQGAEQFAFQAAGDMATKGLATGGRAVYRGYLKPSLAAKNVRKADQVVQTALDEALPVTKGGVGHAQDVIASLRSEVDRILAATPGTTNLKDIADQVRAWAMKTYDRAGRAPEDLQAALAVADRIDKHPSLAAGQSLDVGAPALNQVKRDLQQGVGPQYGVQSQAAKTAEKVGASAARQGTESLAPSVGPLNARESRLIDTARAINQAVNREANQSVTHGVKTFMAAAVGGEEYQRTHDPYMAAAKALALRVGMTPAVATRAAIVAYKLGQKTPGAIPASLARIAVTVASEAQDQPEGGVPNVQQ